MTTTERKRGEGAVADLREFLRFLGNLWGVLATITVLFPLSNWLIAVLPLPPGSERLSSVLATLFSLFAIFFVFVLRHADFGDEYSGGDIGFLIVASLLALGCGVSVLVVYSYVRLEPVAAGVSPVLYAGVFGLFTAAFTLLALAEYIHDEPVHKAAQQEQALEEGREVDDLLDGLKGFEGR